MEEKVGYQSFIFYLITDKISNSPIKMNFNILLRMKGVEFSHWKLFTLKQPFYYNHCHCHIRKKNIRLHLLVHVTQSSQKYAVTVFKKLQKLLIISFCWKIKFSVVFFSLKMIKLFVDLENFGTVRFVRIITF